MPSPRAQLLLLSVLLPGSGPTLPQAAAGDQPMCMFLDAVLKEAPNKFVALRGAEIKGYNPKWEGKLKAPGAKECFASESGYGCLMGAHPRVAQAKQQYHAVKRSVQACFPRWTAKEDRDALSWRFDLRQKNIHVSVEAMGLTLPEGGEEQPEVVLNVELWDE